MGMNKERAVPKFSRVQGMLCVQRATISDVFDPRATWDVLFSHHVFKSIHNKPSKTTLLEDVDLPACGQGP